MKLKKILTFLPILLFVVSCGTNNGVSVDYNTAKEEYFTPISDNTSSKLLSEIFTIKANITDTNIKISDNVDNQFVINLNNLNIKGFTLGVKNLYGDMSNFKVGETMESLSFNADYKIKSPNDLSSYINDNFSVNNTYLNTFIDSGNFYIDVDTALINTVLDSFLKKIYGEGMESMIIKSMVQSIIGNGKVGLNNVLTTDMFPLAEKPTYETIRSDIDIGKIVDLLCKKESNINSILDIKKYNDNSISLSFKLNDTQIKEVIKDIDFGEDFVFNKGNLNLLLITDKDLVINKINLDGEVNFAADGILLESNFKITNDFSYGVYDVKTPDFKNYNIIDPNLILGPSLMIK